MREIELILFRTAKLTMSRWAKLSMLTLLGLCFIGLQSAEAQVIKHPVGLKGKTVKYKIDKCAGASIQYTDDNSVDGKLYSDFGVLANGNATTNPRTDTVEICPQDRWHHVKVTFTEFDIHPSDVLNVHDGSYDSLRAGNAPLIVGLTGNGVSNANGGWVQANCSPMINQTGCLTFIFNTDNLPNDNTKGSGWDSWVTCSDRGIKVKLGNIADKKIDCDAADSNAEITIPKPTIETKCGSIAGNTGLTLLVKKANGETCFNMNYMNLNAVPGTGQPLTGTGNGVGTGTGYGVGVYTAEWFVTSDPAKTTGPKVFSVSLPSLVCNDEIVVPLGSSCGVEVALDDVLENPCDTSVARYLAYGLQVRFGSGKNAVMTGTGSTVNQWPIITRDMLRTLAKNAGTDLTCGGTAEVTVIRRYTPIGAVCDNGVQTSTCKTTLRFKDEQAPVPTVGLTIGGQNIDTLIACDTESLKKLIKIGAVDNCDIKDTTISIRLEENDPCFSSGGMFGSDTTRAFVRVTATDMCGNSRSINKTFIVLRPQTIALPANGRFDCSQSGQATQKPGLRVGYVNNAGMDVITDTIYRLSTTDYYCGYILSSRNVGGDVPDTDCGTKEFIEWSVLDWCTPAAGLSVIDTQFIEYIDTIKPNFVDTTATRPNIRLSLTNPNSVLRPKPKQIAKDAKVSLGHFECTFDANKLPKPAAIDNCDKNVIVSISTVYWATADRIRQEVVDRTKLKCGTYWVVWKADDVCHEQQVSDFAYQFLTVSDDTKPSAACVDQLNVSVPNEWGAVVNVKDVDAGSFDACGIASRRIRIKGSGLPWDTIVKIGCEFVHPDLQIEMQVLDEKGNENICWVDVLVEDKILPICEPPKDLTFDCEKYHSDELGASTDTDEDLKMESSEWVALTGDLMAFYNKEFGAPKCEDNLAAASCGQLEYEQQYQLIKWPCGEAKASRRYRAKDWSGNLSSWVTQNITITTKQNWKITFPGDFEGKCGAMAPGDTIEINNGPCDLLGYEVTEKQFDIPGDACFKIERTYHVINWCKYVAGDEPVELARVEGDHGFANGLMITSEGNENKGYFTYIQVLKVHDDVAPVVSVINPDSCITGVDFDAIPYGEEDITPGSAPFECDQEKTWSAIAVDCSSNISWVGKLFNAQTGALVKEVTSSEITFVVSANETYFAEFWAYDNCGNSGGEKGTPVKFRDCKKPTPYVLNGVAVELMQTQMVQVWATDLNQNSFDNCTDQSKLDFRIWADFLGEAPTTLAGVQALGKVITFPCNRVGTNVVYIYVIDEAGNWDFAQTYVIVQDNMNVCGGDPVEGGMVAGTIVNPQGENVESVEVSISGADQQTITTGADGHFMFMAATGEDYTVTPTKDINPLNGVSTFDLVLISKHILGINQFDSPYKYIAADVNKSGSITAFDMVQLRQLILNITTEFPGNDSWRFIDASHEFTSDNAATEDFSEFYTINALAGNMEDLDFIGVKIGDVNGNAKANSLLGAETRSTNGALTLTAADRFVEAGETVTVAFTAPEIENAQGYQFTLNFAGQDAKIGEGVAKAANFNTNLADRGVIATSWNGEATATDVLFSMTFNATASGLLSELVSVSSDITTAEAYNTAGELLDVNLEFAAVAAAGFDLGQNSPNPFNGATVIGFNLPVAGSATLTVMDAQGKVLKAITADYAKGANQVSLNANELGATGVLYYQLESADNVATKKMIIIE